MELLTYPPEIAAAINAIMGEVDYIQKRGENKFHGYKFAAVGDILSKLQPAMAKHGLIIIQSEVEHTIDGVVAMVKYEFILAHKSGAVMPERFVHTGVATATNTKGGFDDKCLNKCMTAARKYFLLALFQIPTGEEADADAQEDVAGTGSVKVVSPNQAVGLKAETKADLWGGPLKKTEFKAVIRDFSRDIEACADSGQLTALLNSKQAMALIDQCMRDMPSWWYGAEGSDVQGLAARIETREKELKQLAVMGVP